MSMELKVVFNLILSLKNKNKYSKMMAKKKNLVIFTDMRFESSEKR